MIIGILQCDNVPDELKTGFVNYPAMLSALAWRVDPGLQIKVYAAFEEELPQHTDECDAYITTGSRHSANDEYEWIKRLADFIVELDRVKKKYVGICFGHQLAAKALGGKVEKVERGWGVGVSFNRVERQRQWMTPFQPTLDLVVSHQDQVTELPPGACVLASSDFCPYYLLQFSEHAISVQGHPEFSRDYSRALIHLRRDRIPTERAEQAIESLMSDVDSELMMRWIIQFIQSG